MRCDEVSRADARRGAGEAGSRALTGADGWAVRVAHGGRSGARRRAGSQAAERRQARGREGRQARGGRGRVGGPAGAGVRPRRAGESHTLASLLIVSPVAVRVGLDKIPPCGLQVGACTL